MRKSSGISGSGIFILKRWKTVLDYSTIYDILLFGFKKKEVKECLTFLAGKIRIYGDVGLYSLLSGPNSGCCRAVAGKLYVYLNLHIVLPPLFKRCKYAITGCGSTFLQLFLD